MVKEAYFEIIVIHDMFVILICSSQLSFGMLLIMFAKIFLIIRQVAIWP